MFLNKNSSSNIFILEIFSLEFKTSSLWACEVGLKYNLSTKNVDSFKTVSKISFRRSTLKESPGHLNIRKFSF